MLLFGKNNPIASPTHAMVFAVYWPPHAPWPGQATFSRACTSLSGQAPAANRCYAPRLLPQHEIVRAFGAFGHHRQNIAPIDHAIRRLGHLRDSQDRRK